MKKLAIFAAVLICSGVSNAYWTWDFPARNPPLPAHYTPVRILVQSGYMRVQFSPDLPNLDACPMTFPGGSITESSVGTSTYKALHANLLLAMQNQSKMEVMYGGCNNGGMAISGLTIYGP